MDIRRLECRDAVLAREAIATLKITDDTLRRQLSAEYMNRFLAKPENYLIVAIADDKPVGYLVGYLLDRIDRDQPMMMLYEIGVDDAYRQRGIGTAMIDLFKLYCRKQNVMKMWVHTNQSNLAAVALYQSTGGVGDSSGDEISFLFTPEGWIE